MRALVALTLVALALGCSDDGIQYGKFDRGIARDGFVYPDFPSFQKDQAVGQQDLGPKPDGVTTVDGAPTLDPKAFMWAHSKTSLYRIDPVTFAETKVGDFTPTPKDDMTDIAVDKNGQIYAVAWEYLYKVDPTTAAITFIGESGVRCNALTFADIGGVETLLGATGGSAALGQESELVKIDITTAKETVIGKYGSGYRSSGDLVYNAAIGLMATVQPHTGGGNARLATVDVATGAVTAKADSGYTDFWGIAFWKGLVYSFHSSGKIMSMNVGTGATTVVKTGIIPWWGAAVTTVAPSS